MADEPSKNLLEKLKDWRQRLKMILRREDKLEAVIRAEKDQSGVKKILADILDNKK